MPKPRKTYKPRKPVSQAQRNLMWGNHLRRRKMHERVSPAIAAAFAAGDSGGKLPYTLQKGVKQWLSASQFKQLRKMRKQQRSIGLGATGYYVPFRIGVPFAGHFFPGKTMLPFKLTTGISVNSLRKGRIPGLTGPSLTPLGRQLMAAPTLPSVPSIAAPALVQKIAAPITSMISSGMERKIAQTLMRGIM